ncbi:MAG: DUF2177 family protein [Alphaproteobacteria bacterium]|nr:DUF2177 family protein [Alphaproteobacteria bacterium]MDE2498846.1 DUF2177 family protein [Alphaproteobacteria bacterium]
MTSYAIRYGVVLAVLAVGDALWLGYFANAVFRPTLGAILRDPPNWIAAALFYLLYAAGVVIFATGPALRANSWATALLYGALFGLFTYMTYDLTNLATIRLWTIRLAAMDIAWGIALTAFAATASAVICRFVASPHL